MEGLGVGENRSDHSSVKKRCVSLSAAPLSFANVCWFPFSLFVIKNPADTWWCEQPGVVPTLPQVIELWIQGKIGFVYKNKALHKFF